MVTSESSKQDFSSFKNANDVRLALKVNNGRLAGCPEKAEKQHRRMILAWQAFERIRSMATNKKLFQVHPRLVFEANQWMCEMVEGKPRQQIDQNITGSIRVFPDEFKAVEMTASDVTLTDAEYRVLPDTPSVMSTIEQEEDNELDEDE
jgi:hypothetical protein